MPSFKAKSGQQLDLLILREVPASLDHTAEISLFILGLVLVFDLRKTARTAVGWQRLSPRTRELDRRNKDFRQGPFQELLLRASGLPAGQGDLGRVLAGATRFE